LATEAICADEKEQYESAVVLYSNLIEQLLALLQSISLYSCRFSCMWNPDCLWVCSFVDTHDENEKKKLRTKIEGYMARAEFVKELVPKHKATREKKVREEIYIVQYKLGSRQVINFSWVSCFYSDS